MVKLDQLASSERDRLLEERIKECKWWPTVIALSAVYSLILTGIWMLLEGKLIPGIAGFGPLPLRNFFLGLFEHVFVGAIVLLTIGTFGAMARGLHNEENRQAEAGRKALRERSVEVIERRRHE